MSEVFVLGAGFTKAFLPDAPLMVDDYGGEALLERFRPFVHATRILKLELDRQSRGRIDIERLMTRLDGRMPYNAPLGAQAQLALLLSEVKQSFMAKLLDAKRKSFYESDLTSFARWCVTHEITCITFNYDDLFDEALWDKAIGIPGSRYWHPDGGYGFFCKPSSDCIQVYGGYKDKATIHLLKLHGSVNWRARLGWKRPYGVDTIVHNADWYLSASGPELLSDEASVGDIERHLEPDPFIVPPVLVKSALVEEPLLQTVWSLAHKALQDASEVAFVGYSLPVTDIAARTLFSEAIQPRTTITVVNRPPNAVLKERVKDSYKQLFPNLKEDHFIWQDARTWCSSRTGESVSAARIGVPSLSATS